MVVTYAHTDAYIYPGPVTLDCTNQLIAIRDRNAQHTAITVYDQQDGCRSRSA